MKSSLLIALLLLSSCGPNYLSKTEIKVIIPEENMFNCPLVESFPDSNTLTDLQVAQLIIDLYSNNKTCFNSIEAIKAFLKEAKMASEKIN